MSKTSFQIYSLGCKVNQYDAAVLRRALLQRGFKVGQNPELVIINTCSVTHSAIAKDRQLIKKLRRSWPAAWLVIMGCWPETDEKISTAVTDEKVIFWGVGQTEGLIKKIGEVIKNEQLNQEKYFESGREGELLAATDRSRYFLKIGDGCNQFCSYCLIPFARGRLTSRSSAEIIKEAMAATNAGYREIILCGIHLGLYGTDKPGKEKDLVALIQEVLKIKNLGRIRLSSIEITEVTPKLIKLMAKEKKICRHLHISLQSGNDKILKLMNRPYTIKDFARVAATLRKAMPQIAISTDIIVGFPGETTDDFMATYNFAKKINFSKIHVFSFSAHEKTRAYQMVGKVNPADIKERSRELRALSEKLEKDYEKWILNSYKKGDLPLVLEKGGGKKKRVKTEFGFDLLLDKKELNKNTLV